MDPYSVIVRILLQGPAGEFSHFFRMAVVSSPPSPGKYDSPPCNGIPPSFLIYTRVLTTGCQTRQRPFNVLCSTFKVRTGETKGARTEERGTRQKGQGDKNSRNFYPAFIKSRGLNILNAKGRSSMSRRSLSPVMRISAFAA